MRWVSIEGSYTETSSVLLAYDCLPSIILHLGEYIVVLILCELAFSLDKVEKLMASGNP